MEEELDDGVDIFEGNSNSNDDDISNVMKIIIKCIRGK